MLSLLGWKVAMEEKKRKEFNRKFVSLGVQIDFNFSEEGKIVVENKEGRVDVLWTTIKDIRDKGWLGFKEALSVRGKMGYAEGQLFSRVAAPACRILSRWAKDGRRKKVTEELLYALAAGLYALQTGGPRVVIPAKDEQPVLLFSDGACEPDGTTIGAVIFVPGLKPELFGAVMAQSTIDLWKTKLDQTQVIGQAELFPLLIARLTWKKYISNRRMICFIDNDSARLGLIKAYSPVLPSLDIISRCLGWDHANNCSSWLTRVPSDSNIADAPSRMDPRYLVDRHGARIVKPIALDNHSFTDVL